ncbi:MULTISPECIES: HIT family protein [unclassified Sphingomonas]|uniref:HIT family protein n=1 Tax=unclassified Sphingomonas TaxID=196159 RepID=UPI000A9276EE|nr:MULTISPECIES: HIT domain-containing protein [unclassified Sphingomonas]
MRRFARRSIGAWLLVPALGMASVSSGKTRGVPAGDALPCPLDAPYDGGNVFARIVRGELPASIVAQDARVMAIIPLEWERPGHTLVIPKRPVRNLYDLRDRDLVAVMAMVRRVATAQRRALGNSGFSLQQNNASSQHVCHLHVHVIPDTPRVPRVRASRAEMEAMAQRLRAALPAR